MKKVFLDDLPRTIYRGKICIDWHKSIGCKVRSVYDDLEGWLTIEDYIKGTHSKLKVKYLKNKFNFLDIGNFAKCKLGGLLETKTSNFKFEIGCKLKDKHRDIVITESKHRNGRKYYKFKCNKCGFECGEHYKNQEYKEELWITECNVMKGSGCSCCNGKVVVVGINDVPTTAPSIVRFFPNGYDEAKLYTKNSGKSIYPICPDCGRIKTKSMLINTIYRNKAIGCSCGDGFKYPEKLMFSVLEQFKSDFETQYYPDWCKYTDFNNKNKIKTGRYDFVLNDYPYIIEMDGGFHSKDNNMSGQTKEESKYIDDIKDSLARQNDYEVIRIDCAKSSLVYIKQNILNSKLNELFDLSKIDWNQCEEFIKNNLKKQVCSYYKTFLDTTANISNKFNLSVDTIRTYLKDGTELGWCNYDPKESVKKSSSILGKNTRKKVRVFKDDVFLGEFESLHKLEELSKEIFDVKFFRGHISRVCNGKLEQYKGFIFSY